MYHCDSLIFDDILTEMRRKWPYECMLAYVEACLSIYSDENIKCFFISHQRKWSGSPFTPDFPKDLSPHTQTHTDTHWWMQPDRPAGRWPKDRLLQCRDCWVNKLCCHCQQCSCVLASLRLSLGALKSRSKMLPAEELTCFISNSIAFWLFLLESFSCSYFFLTSKLKWNEVFRRMSL